MIRPTRRAVIGLAAAAAAASLSLTSCAGSATPAASESSSANPADVAGDITFLTNRTDLEKDGTLGTYVAEFNKTYPKVNVKIEAITAYEDDVRTRMSTPNGYGDVLLVPDAVGVDQYPDFFDELGSVDELSKDYRFVSDKALDGKVYALAVGGNTFGVLYNKSVWAQAGITELPSTPEEFLSDLQLIKDKTKATPYYTNYKDGWPLAGQWTDNVAGVGGSAETENQWAEDSSPWSDGKPAAVVDGLLFDIVKNGLSEADPLTTNWEQSKADFASGKIASMTLGSWAVSQFQEVASNKDDVGFMPFPGGEVNGQRYAKIGGDRRVAINKNSKNKAAAKAWMEWLVKDSGFAASQGMISPSKAITELPSNLSEVTKANVELFENNPPAAGKEGLLNNVADASQVDIWGNIYRRQLVDTARGQAKGDKASFFADLNKRWADAVAQLAS